ncbi:MAG: hypothetical protein VX727_09780 [Planctomycetota bacterium]|nr:hypothetical protein [Planctomycetota bacterium]
MNRYPLLVLMVALTGCGETRTQYRTMPAFYQRMAGIEGANNGRMRDGTEIRWQQGKEASLDGFTDHTGDVFLMRDEREDGTTSLNALIPEHVMLNTLECVRDQEYRLLWDELVADGTKRWYEEEGGGYEAYESFFRANRRDIVTTLTRMKAGLGSQELRRVRLADGVTRLELIEQLHSRFRYTLLDASWDGEGYRLLTIR